MAPHSIPAKSTFRIARTLLLVLISSNLLLAGSSAAAFAHDDASPARINTVQLDAQIRSFLAQQILAHVAGIKTLDPPPDRALGALTTDDFSWGTFMGALARYSPFAGTTTVVGRNVIPMLGRMAQIELSHGGETWAQIYAALALRSFGTDLNHNALWQGLIPQEKAAYRELLDPGRFYDAKTHTLIGLPQNYFGVAARIASISYQLGIDKNRVALDDLLDRAALQFTTGALFADDALPTGRYDRYSNEYARNIYEAAALAGRTDIMNGLSRSLRAQMQLWWELMSSDGYGYSWGRSLGDISYTDTMQIVAFVAKYPQFRPASISDLAAAYYQAWRSLLRNFNDGTRLFSVFAFGRGDYGYITKSREWQKTTSFFGKITSADETFMNAINGDSLRRTETITASKNVTIHRFWVAVPSTANHIDTSFTNGARKDTLSSGDSTLTVKVLHSERPIGGSAFATGNDLLGRGAQRPIPFHLILQSKDVSFAPGQSKTWAIEFSATQSPSDQ